MQIDQTEGSINYIIVKNPIKTYVIPEDVYNSPFKTTSYIEWLHNLKEEFKINEEYINC